MRKALVIASVLFASSLAPATAAEPDLSPATLARLDDRLWAAGDDWRQLFDTLPLEQQKALVAMNAVARVEYTSEDRPPACEWAVDCDDLEPLLERTPAGGTPGEREPYVEVLPPAYECNGAQGTVRVYNITGKVIIEHVDWISYCVHVSGYLNHYSHGQAAATYGWGWQVGTCICIERAYPPIGNAYMHEFHSKQTYSRQFGAVVDVTDSHTTHMEGYARVDVAGKGRHHIFGWG